MLVDWISFTPWPALLGGVLIGAAASLLLLANSRIAGISGIVAGLFHFHRGDMLWRVMFILGLLLSPVVYSFVNPLPVIQFSTPWPLLIIAGLLVGFGTRLGSGCTSGHGVCGLARLSRRSLLATLTFMLFGFITTFILRHGVLN